MKLYHSVHELPSPLACSVVSIGNFDGLHLGHQALIQTLLRLAKSHHCSSVIYTFEPHPVTVLHPEKGLKNLSTRGELADRLGAMGVEIAIFESFTKEFARIPPRQFVKDYLCEPLHPVEITV